MNTATLPGADAFTELSKLSWELATRGPKLLGQMVRAQTDDATISGSAQLQLTRAFGKLWWQLLRSPIYLARAQADLAWDTLSLFRYAALRGMGQKGTPAAEPAKRDRRFRDPVWEQPLFDLLKQSYLIMSRWMLGTVDNVAGLDEQTQEQVSFYTRQYADAIAPSNFLWTNPKVLQVTAESNGANLVRGVRQLLEDLERGEGRLAIQRTDLSAFEVGRDLAITPGKVVYQNELMQLIQYSPTTPKVHERPLLIVPPWINKYYVLDLQPENSYVRWAVEQGLTVFMISWINPDASLAHKSFDDYLREGPLEALDAIAKATGQSDVTAVGYCLGGTLLSATLALLAARGDERIRAATFFTTLVDFAEPGELSVYIDEAQIAMLEREMNKTGILEASKMQTAFNMLRANELIWSYVVHNYLLGRDPFPFDLLYWNADSTNMPAAMHAYYLRNMYLDNSLCEPGGLTLDGEPIDLRKVKQPVYLLSCAEDHIAPWTSTYAATQLYQGPQRVVLAGSGHIAGVINPPAKNKYGYWTNDKAESDPEVWQAGATQHEGSWWPDWAAWNAEHAGKLIPARHPGSADLPPLEDAPGSYVK